MSKYLNLEIVFPILIMSNGEFIVIKRIEDFTTCKYNFINDLKYIDEFVLDSNGDYFKRIDINFVEYSNIFRGISLKFAGFGKCRVKKDLYRVKTLTIIELKETAISFLNFYKKIGAGSKEDFIKMKNKINEIEDKNKLINLIMSM